jgi:hypothetical protein
MPVRWAIQLDPGLLDPIDPVRPFLTACWRAAGYAEAWGARAKATTVTPGHPPGA